MKIVKFMRFSIMEDNVFCSIKLWAKYYFDVSGSFFLAKGANIKRKDAIKDITGYSQFYGYFIFRHFISLRYFKY